MMTRLCLALAVTLFGADAAFAQPIPGMSEGETVVLIATLALVIFAAVGAYQIYAGVRNRRTARASELWPVAGGTVLSSEVVTRTTRSKNKTTTTYYKPQIRYSYGVAGADYESSVIRFGDLEGGSRKVAEEFVTKYPAGATVSVRYDPERPDHATLETESAGGSQILSGIFFIVVPLIIVIGALLIIIMSEDMEKSLPPEVLERLNQPNQDGLPSGE